MTNELTPKDKQWIKEGFEKGFTGLQMIKKLKDSNYPRERIDLFIEYLEELKYEEERKKEETPRDLKDEREFETNVKKFQEGKELTWSERRQVKKWIKNVNKYIKVLDETIRALKREYKLLIEKQQKRGTKTEDDFNDLKKEIADRILDAKEILIIEDPNTGEEATKDSLLQCTLDQLIEMLEESVNTLKETVEGKITKE